MKMKIKKSILCLFLSLFYLQGAQAAFPDDFEDVVFIEGAGIGAFVSSFAVTATLDVQIGGSGFQGKPNVILDSSKKNSWPNGRGDLSCCNANAWGFVKIGEIWYAGSWEFLRRGQTVKSLAAFVGPRHFRFPPLANFQPKNGEVYGFMVSGFTRNNLPNNIRERSEVAFYRLGVGPVSADEIRGDSGDAPSAPSLAPVTDLLFDD